MKFIPRHFMGRRIGLVIAMAWVVGCGTNTSGVDGAGGSGPGQGGSTTASSGGTSGGTMTGMGGMMHATGGMAGTTMMATGGGPGAGGMMMGDGGMMPGTGDSGATMGTGGMMSSPDAGGGDTEAACRATGTLQVKSKGMTSYLVDGVANPDLTFCRGVTYVFAVSATGHPFYISTVQTTGTANAYSTGVTGNGTTTGNVTFVVPNDAPDTLYYICSLHPGMSGIIHIVGR